MAYAKKRKLKDGTLRYYAVYMGADGKYHEEVGCPTRRAAEKIAMQKENDAARGEWSSPRSAKTTFARFLDSTYWPTTKHLEVTTTTSYRYVIERHFVPRFGHMRMSHIQPSTIQSWVNEASNTLSARSVVKYHAVLNRIFATAVIDRVISVNPCAHTRLPKVILKPKQIVTPDEFGAIHDSLDPHYRTMVRLAIETGVRWGELIALRPCDVDFGTSLVTIPRTIAQAPKKWSPTGERLFFKDTPKDDETRHLRVRPEICALLREHMMSNGVRDDALLFVNAQGEKICKDYFRKFVWLPAVTAAHLTGRRPTFHNLRAAHASWSLAGGADLVSVKNRLGHRSITTTQQYLGTLPESEGRLLDAFGRIINGTG